MLTNLSVIPNKDWEASHKKIDFKKTIFLLAVSTIILLKNGMSKLKQQQSFFN
jgi:hypothetical protein